MIYLASPYSSPIPTVVEERYGKTLAFTLGMLMKGYPIFSPIAYVHPFAVAGKLPTDAEHWHHFNMQFLRKAEAMFVLHLIGWDQSKGVQMELKVAKAINLPIVHFSAEGRQLNQDGEQINDGT